MLLNNHIKRGASAHRQRSNRTISRRNRNATALAHPPKTVGYAQRSLSGNATGSGPRSRARAALAYFFMDAARPRSSECRPEQFKVIISILKYHCDLVATPRRAFSRTTSAQIPCPLKQDCHPTNRRADDKTRSRAVTFCRPASPQRRPSTSPAPTKIDPLIDGLTTPPCENDLQSIDSSTTSAQTSFQAVAQPPPTQMIRDYGQQSDTGKTCSSSIAPDSMYHSMCDQAAQRRAVMARLPPRKTARIPKTNGVANCTC